jgi:EF-P beta-lysylation protein EpmB
MEAVEKNSPHKSWQHEMGEAFTKLDELLSFLRLDINDLSNYNKAHQTFPLLVSRSYAERMTKSDPNDSLLRQVLPSPAELITHPDYTRDPVGDQQASVIPGLIHKYHGRILIVTTGACAIHCRYCFRRAFPYSDNSANPSQTESIMRYLRDNTDIQEVIFSGGDPLMMNDQRLANYFKQLTEIKHIKRIRIHSRLPIVLPSRITDDLLSLFDSLPQQLILVVHTNHAQELSSDVEHALSKLRQVIPHLFNQTVLLKGVNDNANTLIKLSHRLFDQHVIPYYLHTLDKIEGAQHFDIPLEEAFELYKKLQSALPGYLVPKLVKEEAGKPHKTQLTAP